MEVWRVAELMESWAGMVRKWRGRGGGEGGRYNGLLVEVGGDDDVELSEKGGRFGGDGFGVYDYGDAGV